jgi:hypothetical protein
MWEYRIIRLREEEYKELNAIINQIKQDINTEFGQTHPDWSETEKGMTKIERQEFLREIYYERMHKKIKSILPGIIIVENSQYQFDPINYLEAKLNELGKAGWELDRIRLTKPTSFTDGILIFRRKRVQ